MANHSSATVREHIPHVNQTSRTNTIVNALKRRAVAGADMFADVHACDGKVEALAEIICSGGEESTAALLVLMGTLVDSTDPKALANTAKHFAFTRCGELNFGGMVDAQITLLESELLRE